MKKNLIDNTKNLDEISSMLADNILSENILSKEKIIQKCKIYFKFWQRINSFPKKDNVNYQILMDAASYKTLRDFIYDKFTEKINRNEIEILMKEFYQINDLLKNKIENNEASNH